MIDTEVEVLNSQSNLAGEPSATTKSLGGLVNARGRRERRLHVGSASAELELEGYWVCLVMTSSLLFMIWHFFFLFYIGKS